ncbi:hypothetical protein FRC10_006613 [Ceratobasidium sp. 414]|nr:hypothetical protein FRC10_006613 [Ceratobasidium sp. 414]
MFGLFPLSGLLVLDIFVASLQLDSKIVDDSYGYAPTRLDGIQYSPDWVDVSNALISVALDSGDEEFVNSTAPSTQSQQLLWSRTGLGPGDHQVVIKHNGTTSQYLGLDYLR